MAMQRPGPLGKRQGFSLAWTWISWSVGSRECQRRALHCVMKSVPSWNELDSQHGRVARFFALLILSYLPYLTTKEFFLKKRNCREWRVGLIPVAKN